MSAAVFISHASKDSAIARTICEALEHRGLNCWISSRDIQPGENFQVAIVRAIRSVKAMVLVFSSNASNSEEIAKELALAGQSHLVVIPVRVEDVTPDDAFAYEFATRQWVDVFDDWEQAIQRLVRQLSAVVGAADVGPSGALVESAAQPLSSQGMPTTPVAAVPARGHWSIFATLSAALIVVAAAGATWWWLHGSTTPPKSHPQAGIPTASGSPPANAPAAAVATRPSPSVAAKQPPSDNANRPPLGRQAAVDTPAPPVARPDPVASEPVLAEVTGQARDAFNRKDYAAAMRFSREAADRGDPIGQRQVGFLHLNGLGVAKDYSEAARWYRLAADQGDAIAQTDLGILYEQGHGVQRDYIEALRLFLKAADHGNGLAAINIGMFHQNGWGIPIDYDEARRWYEKAAARGAPAAQAHLGLLYQNGWGVVQDDGQAVRRYRFSADQGSPYGEFMLGLRYVNGRGVPRDASAGRELIEKAAAGGNDAAQEWLTKHPEAPR
jgi:TIR domain/Sel1 repeat